MLVLYRNKPEPNWLSSDSPTDITLKKLRSLSSLDHHLDDLGSLSAVHGYLTIEGNDSLSDIDGLASLIELTGFLRVYDNPSLPTCAVQKLVEQLQNQGWTGSAYIQGNDNIAACD